MSYFNKVNIQASDSSSIDAFGRWRVSETGNRFDVEFVYDKQPEIVDEIIGGDGSATHNANPRDITLAVGGTAEADKAELYSFDVPYTPGNSQLIEITGVLDLANLGGTVDLVFRTSVTGTLAEATYAQSTWTTNQTGVNWKYSHIFVIDFQSLKVGRIRTALSQNGLLSPLKEIRNDNLRNSGYWQLPSLPVCWRIYNDADNTYMEMGYGDEANGIFLRHTVAKNANATMKAICATVKSEGGYPIFELPGFPRTADMGVTEKTVSTTLIPLISIKPATTFHSLPNRGISIPEQFSITTDNPIKVVLLHHNTLTNANWVDVDANESIMQYDVSATATTSGHTIYSEYVNAGKNIATTGGNLLGRTLLWNRRDSVAGAITVAAIKTGTTDASVLAGIVWKEIR